MTGLKLLGAAAMLFSALASALAVSAAAQEAVQEPGALGQNHPFVDYLTGGYPGTWHVGADGLRRFCR